MNALELGLLVAALMLPFHFLVMREMEKLTDPAHLRREGVVIVQPRVLEARSAPIGTYMGQEIWASVTFMGMRYRFDRIVAPAYRYNVGRRELYLEPGLVYLTD